ncbi:zonular occludens toxin domain-containing protein [Delftia tsuruhatensis]|uniref:zonular occludens toxin domain-containing protein n=1 Tax=Delftia tsuruhatensis TaxID=180282 RepID=UPI002260A0C0|nr:zonular occludens toxin domain-containing protein [Delftia tsuruhatensis]MCX7504281.1 zonular occludens toxin [Delftia tsuruhatensis]
MINALEGIPGSGKSYEAVAYHVLPALRAGRKVITNLPLIVDAFAAIDPSWRDLIEIRTRPAPRIGDWNAANITEHEAFRLWTDREPEPQPENIFTFGSVWDYYSTWRGDKDQGPLYVIDECHVALPKLGTPDAVVQWFKLHRHYNAEVLLMTQSFRDINQPIAQLVATMIKCRKADILGNADEYIRKVHAGYRGAVIQTDRRKYESKYFGLYKSNTQSSGSAESKAQDVSPMIVKFKRFTWLFWGFAIAYMVYAFWPEDGKNVWGHKTAPAAKKSATSVPVQVQHAPAAQHAHQGPAQAQQQPLLESQPPAAPEIKDPLYGKLLHMTGDLSKAGRDQITFVVSSEGRRVFDVTSDDLREAGYKVQRLANCMVTVTYQSVVRPVTCDAPYTASGRGDKPIVIDAGSGARSDRPTAPQVQQAPQIVAQQQPQHEGYSAGLARRNAQVRSGLMY